MHIPKEQAHRDLELFLDILPVTIREPLLQTGRVDDLLEVVLDLGRQPTARFADGEIVLRDAEVLKSEIDQVVAGTGQIDDDNRAGIARTLHRISAIRNRRGDVVGLTCRIGRAVYGTIDIILDLVEENRSVLLLGRPGVGKTTMLREMARVLADEKRVVIVDTSNEIGGDGDIPHPAVGRARRMQVPHPSHQHETMIEAVENHNPEVIIIDEIGRSQEAAAARTINERGVQLIGTAHGRTLENLLRNPTLSDLVGGIESVTLSDDEARRRGTQKTVLERRAPATFDILIEIQDRQRLIVHREVIASVDAMLRGRAAHVELRYRDEAGQIQIEEQEMLTQTPAVTGRRMDLQDDAASNGKRESRRKVNDNGKSNGQRALVVDVDSAENNKKRASVFAYGVARNRLLDAAKNLGIHVDIVDSLDEANYLVTLKSFYRKRRRLILEAEQARIPVYVLRANTVHQMENFLAQALGLEVMPTDPFERAIDEVGEAIRRVKAGEQTVNLRPVGHALRRYQHQMARQSNLTSHSYGREPNRYVRIYSVAPGGN